MGGHLENVLDISLESKSLLDSILQSIWCNNCITVRPSIVLCIKTIITEIIYINVTINIDNIPHGWMKIHQTTFAITTTAKRHALEIYSSSFCRNCEVMHSDETTLNSYCVSSRNDRN